MTWKVLGLIASLTLTAGLNLAATASGNERITPNSALQAASNGQLAYATNKQQSGDAMSKPGDAINCPANAMSQTGNAMNRPGNAMSQTGNAMNRPGNAMSQTGNAMSQTANAMPCPGNSMSQPGR